MPRLVDAVVSPGRISALDQPVLPAGEDVALRPWRVDDAQGLIDAFSDPLIQRWHMRSFGSATEALEWIEGWHERWASESAASWAVATSAGHLRGYLGLHGLNLEMGSAQISYWVLPSARGLGIASLATTAVSAWLFEDVGLHRLWLMHSVQNEPSCRVASKAGFSVEGTLRDGLLHADGWHDMHVHGRLANDAVQSPARS